MPVFILSQPIHTGKTTLLMQWVKSRNDVAGILTPDLAGLRRLYDIKQRSFFDFQKTGTPASGDVPVGKFLFDGGIFLKAQEILLQAMQQQTAWLVIDEIGRLELDRKTGLEPAVSAIIHPYKTGIQQGNLLLVIRDYLLDDCIAYYGLQDAKVIDASFFQAPGNSSSHHDVYGIVMCGGRSTRMGTDKSTLEYHHKPQRYHLYDLMGHHCKQVYISCNNEQAASVGSLYPCITDHPQHSNSGPLSGLLAATETLPGKHLMLTGCDYPFIQHQHLSALSDAFRLTQRSVCYMSGDFEEPLLAIYSSDDLDQLKTYLQSGQQSLRHFLKQQQAEKLVPAHTAFLQSVDTYDQYLTVKAMINI